MEKRLLVAVLLMSAVIMVTNLLFPPVEEEPAERAAATAPAARQAPAPAPVMAAPQAAVRADTVVVTSPLYRYAFSTRGAALVRAELLQYPSYTEQGQPVQLVPRGTQDFLSHRLVVGSDTLDLSRVGFQPSAPALRVDESTGEQQLRFSYAAPGGVGAEITYSFRSDQYLVGVRGRVTGLNNRPAVLLTSMGPGLGAHEALEHQAQLELATVSRTVEDEVERVRLEELEAPDTVVGRLTWAGIKDKYFLAAQVTGAQTPLTAAITRPLRPAQQRFVQGEDTTVVAFARAQLTTALPLGADGTFAYSAYLGPQEFAQLKAVGHNLQDVTQYAYAWLEPIIRPFAAFILNILGWLHDSLGVAYGWTLILFGILMRIVTWPLNAKAMRSQMKTAAVAPLLQELREKYKDDPAKQQQEMMRIYREEGVNPLAGCLPMLIPWPVMITLFFVFQNTIVFRGAEFLWFPDLSLKDPIFILPLFLVISMFALQWVSMQVSGADQNPQMKTMMYIMPIMMGVLFFNLPAGLNLYYATTNVASMPQTLLMARERKAAMAKQKEEQAARAATLASGTRKQRRAKG